MAFLALFANYSVVNVSDWADIDGDMQTIKLMRPLPLSVSESTRVSFEFRKGIWVLVLSMSAEIQWPKVERLLLIEVNSCTCSSLSSCVRSYGILNFSDPARSTIFSLLF
jgi:hypothetical protein